MDNLKLKHFKGELSKQKKLISLNSFDFKKINELTKILCEDLKNRFEKNAINAEIFIGGSLAKKTIIKKEKYDIDVFVRFDETYSDKKISIILGKILKKKILDKKAEKIHGSRDYYQLKIDSLIFEIIPVLKINNPNQAKNITDLSYFHVNYLLKKIRKNEKLVKEIQITKSFIDSQDCYGAESYIQGFSGYAIELLICHYKSFLKFIKKISENKGEKIIIDDKKFYKNKKQILEELNESKINGPMILIDPTFKERNALAGLSTNTFEKLKNQSKLFLKNPNKNYFIKKNELKQALKKYKEKLKVLIVKTNKQKGDIAGTKLKKFFRIFILELKKEFKIEISGFKYNERKNLAYYYFILKKKNPEIAKGPPLNKKMNFEKFKQIHPDFFVKKNISYRKIMHETNLREFLENFLKKQKILIKNMDIKKIKLVNLIN